MTVKRPCWQIVTGIVSDNPYEPPWRSSNNSILEVSKLWLVQSQLWRQFGFKRLVGEDWWLKVWKEDKGSSCCIIGPGLCRARMRYEPLGGGAPWSPNICSSKTSTLTPLWRSYFLHCIAGQTLCTGYDLMLHRIVLNYLSFYIFLFLTKIKSVANEKGAGAHTDCFIHVNCEIGRRRGGD